MDTEKNPPFDTHNLRPSAEEMQHTRERLAAVELAPDEMYARAHEILDGAEVYGTSEPITIGKRKIVEGSNRSYQFSYEYDQGRAKVFVPSEGDRALLGATPDAKKDFYGTLIAQVLKLHQKGQRALEAQGTGEVVASKAGKLSEENKARLENAKQAVVDTLLARLSAYEAGRDYDEVEEVNVRAVAEWVKCDDTGAEGIIRDLTDRILANPQTIDSEEL